MHSWPEQAACPEFPPREAEHPSSQPAYGSADKGQEAMGDFQGSRRESINK